MLYFTPVGFRMLLMDGPEGRLYFTGWINGVHSQACACLKLFSFFFFFFYLLCRLKSVAQDSRSTTSVCRPSSCGSSRLPASSTQTTIVGTSFLCECPPHLTPLPAQHRTHSRTRKGNHAHFFPPKSLYCVIEKQKLPFGAFVTNYQARLIIFPSL